MDKEPFFKPIYKRLKALGVKTDPIADKLGISRTALRMWFNDERMDRERGLELAVALEEFSMEVRGVARELRGGFRKKNCR